MRQLSRVGVLAALMVSVAATADAQISSFEELRFVLSPGARVTVMGVDGQEWEGSLLQIASDHVTLAGASGEPRTWLRARVQRLSVEHADSLGNGAFIGAAVGASIGAIPQFGAACKNNPGCSITWVGSSLAGAVVGALVDRMHKSKGLLYEGAPLDATVTAGPNGAAVQVRYRW